MFPAPVHAAEIWVSMLDITILFAISPGAKGGAGRPGGKGNAGMVKAGNGELEANFGEGNLSRAASNDQASAYQSSLDEIEQLLNSHRREVIDNKSSSVNSFSKVSYHLCIGMSAAYRFALYLFHGQSLLLSYETRVPV
jgi:hypothetical protein